MSNFSETNLAKKLTDLKEIIFLPHYLTLIMPCVTIVLLPVFHGIDTLFFFA